MKGNAKSASLPIDDRGLKLVAERFRALADPTRLRIVRSLCGGERCVQDLAEELGIGQTSISKHLALLLQAGIVANRREARFIRYRLLTPEIEDVCRLVCQSIRTRLEEQAEVLDLLH